ncbi:MAG TPA: PEP-CTERM sorting domain-containing protein, partial [Phycisphaerae bacterium]|nr:PEP-CTERM sorting domain-containing protein [Phycisphaerae bacterium]
YSMLWPQGDFNMDHHVGIADLSALADHYGDRLDGGTVPEPASLLLILAGSWACLRRPAGSLQ